MVAPASEQIAVHQSQGIAQFGLMVELGDVLDDFDVPPF